jgi:hypothetical protein
MLYCDETGFKDYDGLKDDEMIAEDFSILKSL